MRGFVRGVVMLSVVICMLSLDWRVNATQIDPLMWEEFADGADFIGVVE